MPAICGARGILLFSWYDWAHCGGGKIKVVRITQNSNEEKTVVLMSWIWHNDCGGINDGSHLDF
jgi:hypothetical protein